MTFSDPDLGDGLVRDAGFVPLGVAIAPSFGRASAATLPAQPLNVTSFVSVTPAVRPGAAWYRQ
jgi:hypothetical protein